MPNIAGCGDEQNLCARDIMHYQLLRQKKMCLCDACFSNCCGIFTVNKPPPGILWQDEAWTGSISLYHELRERSTSSVLPEYM